MILNSIFFSLLYSKTTVYSANHILKCVRLPFTLSVRLLVESRLLVVKFGGSQKLSVDFLTAWGVGPPNPHAVQGAVVFYFFLSYILNFKN